MQEWSVPLIVATTGFLVVLLWRVRPLTDGLFFWDAPRRGASREAIRDAHARIESARSEQERAVELCDAADLVRAASAKGLYLRAMRADPASVDVIRRAAGGLARRPRALESLLWRHLAAESAWRDSRAAVRITLDTLRGLYEGPLRNPTRARALANAMQAIAP
jgi:hypothetical protein